MDGPGGGQARAYTEQADVCSLGMVMWEVATRKLPFAGENLGQGSDP